MVCNPSQGEASAKQVTASGSWENPSWAVDGRHIIASRDKALFIVDTDPDGDKPVRLFYNKGNWMNPSWSK
jgi:Tol biopolymer transport system component